MSNDDDTTRKVATHGVKPGHENEPTPKPINPKTGQAESYWVLSPEDRLKSRVRPLRHSYSHKGLRPSGKTRRLNADEHERYFQRYGYVLFEEYPEGHHSVGRYWTQAQLDSGCDTITRMAEEIAETYARDPGFYGSTFCCGCRQHHPVKEFLWVDGGIVTDEVVGS